MNRSVLLRATMALAIVSAIPDQHCFAADAPADLPQGYKLLYSQDFSNPSALNDFVMADPAAWKLSTADGHTALELTRQSHYTPTVRSPVNLAMISGHVFGDFLLEAEICSTVPDNPHRDMVVAFGMADPTHFYYAHMAVQADDKAHHNIFLVNDTPRARIATFASTGVPWGASTSWHKIRVTRRVETGEVKVFFDNFDKPVLTATDKTFAEGYVGFGSFDDLGKVTNIRIWGPSEKTAKASFYKPSEAAR